MIRSSSRASSSVLGNTATLNLVLGIFLKLLGFFVVLYSYTDIDPTKAKLAEDSLRERFSVSVSLTPDIKGSTFVDTPAVESQGRAMDHIATAMKTQISFLASEYDLQNNVLLLRVPAEVAMDIGDKLARSPDFADIFINTLQTQKSPNMTYRVDAIIKGEAAQNDMLMRSVSLFIQKLIARNYSPDNLMIGYQKQTGKPVLELRIRQVRA